MIYSRSHRNYLWDLCICVAQSRDWLLELVSALLAVDNHSSGSGWMPESMLSGSTAFDKDWSCHCVKKRPGVEYLIPTFCHFSSQWQRSLSLSLSSCYLLAMWLCMVVSVPLLPLTVRNCNEMLSPAGKWCLERSSYVLDIFWDMGLWLRVVSGRSNSFLIQERRNHWALVWL